MSRRKFLSLNRYIKLVLDPVEAWYLIKYRLARKKLSGRFSSYDDFFAYEQKNNFSYTKLKARVALRTDIDLDRPKTFSEKLIHRRLFSRDPIWPIVTDKIAVRAWLKEKGFLEYVNLVPARVAYSVDELLSLPIDKPVVVKAAWASGLNLFVSSNEELLEHKSTLDKWMHSAYAVERLIWAPERMKRGFLVEDSIADENGKVPVDYKFHCFNGKVAFFQLDLDRFDNHLRVIFNRDGKQQEWCYGKKGYNSSKSLDSDLTCKLVEIAERLAAEFSYIRVDLYEYNSKVYFGELTQTQGAGFERFTNNNLYIKYGDLWCYPSNRLGDKLLNGK